MELLQCRHFPEDKKDLLIIRGISTYAETNDFSDYVNLQEGITWTVYPIPSRYDLFSASRTW